MKLSKLIHDLEAIKEKAGDCDIKMTFEDSSEISSDIRCVIEAEGVCYIMEDWTTL